VNTVIYVKCHDFAVIFRVIVICDYTRIYRGGDLGGQEGTVPTRKLSWGDRGAYIPPNIFINVIINCLLKLLYFTRNK